MIFFVLFVFSKQKGKQTKRQTNKPKRTKNIIFVSYFIFVFLFFSKKNSWPKQKTKQKKVDPQCKMNGNSSIK